MSTPSTSSPDQQTERVILRVHHAEPVVTVASVAAAALSAEGMIGADMRGAFYDANRAPRRGRVEIRVVVIEDASETSHGGASQAERQAPAVLVSSCNERTVNESLRPSRITRETLDADLALIEKASDGAWEWAKYIQRSQDALPAYASALRRVLDELDHPAFNAIDLRERVRAAIEGSQE